MRINLISTKGTFIAEVVASGIIINNVQDALDMMSECYYQGAKKIIVREKNISPDIFDMDRGMAEEIIHKFADYDVRLAVIGDFSKYIAKKIFINEINKSGRIFFVNSVSEAKEKLIGG